MGPPVNDLTTPLVDLKPFLSSRVNGGDGNAGGGNGAWVLKWHPIIRGEQNPIVIAHGIEKSFEQRRVQLVSDVQGVNRGCRPASLTQLCCNALVDIGVED
jgi:hypothetical protein